MCWKEIGKELKIANGILNSIHHACSELEDSLWCCKMMFSNWLNLTISKGVHNSWDSIHKVIYLQEIHKTMEIKCTPSEFPKIRDIDKVMCEVACKIQVNSIRLRHAPPTDSWPLMKPQHFTSVAIIYHKKRIKKEIIKLIAKVQQDGNVSNDINIENHSAGKFSNIKSPKDLSELFVNDPNHVLIEGAPGIGKTTLAEEIVFQWSLGNVLEKKKLLLLIYLRNPACKSIASFRDLIQHCIMSVTELETTKISMLQNYIIESQADKVVLILDGYDELPIDKIKDNDFFINKLIKKQIGDFTRGTLIVTSRPNVSVYLHKMVDHRVEILGFTEENRMEYIRQALRENADEKNADEKNADGENADKKNEDDLQAYLLKNPAINSHCYIPLNMTMVLYLFNELGSISNLPTTQTGINKLFVCHTISRYIKKVCDAQEIEFTGSDFSKIPAPFEEVFIEMSAYSFHALNDGKIVFEKNEIKECCPHLTLDPKSWNGLGLLKAVQFYSIIECEPNVSFNFLHLSIQELLAAYHVTLKHDSDQINLLRKTFWDPKYYNMWIMYVGLTKGQSFSFNHFLSGNLWKLSTRNSLRKTQSVVIPRSIITDRIKCLRLFQCFSEAEDTEMCKYVGQLLQNRKIDLSEQSLRPAHINTLSIFLVQTNSKEWELLNLSKCYLADEGFSRLYKSVSSARKGVIYIETLDLSFNDLTKLSAHLIVSLIITWNVKELNLDSNDIDLTTMITEFICNPEFHNSSMVIKICKINESAWIVSDKICKINESAWIFSDKVYPDELTNIEDCSRIFLYNCDLGNEQQLLNTVLLLLKSRKEIYLYGNSLPLKFVTKIVRKMKDLSLHYMSVDVCQNELTEITKELALNAACAIRFDKSLLPLHIYNGTLQNFSSLEESLTQKDVCGTFVFKNIQNKCIKKVCRMLLQVNSTIEYFSLKGYNMEIDSETNSYIVNVLRKQQLKYLDMSSTLITAQETKAITDAITNIMSLTSLNFSNCGLQDNYMLAVCKAITNINSISYLNFCNNNINFESAKALADAMVNKSSLQQIDLYNCNLNEQGMIAILSALIDVRKLNLGANIITDEAAKCLKQAIACNFSMTCLYLCDCALQHSNVYLITEALQESKLFIELDLSCNAFSNQNCRDIANAVELNNNITHLNMSNCELEEEGMLLISDALTRTECLLFLNLSGNQINSSAAQNIATTVCNNNRLKYLALSRCVLSVKGFKSIIESMKTKLQDIEHFDISYINITNEVALDIAAIIEINGKLQFLNISDCALQENGLVPIVNAIRKADMLEYLNVSNNKFNAQATSELAMFVSKSNSLEHLHLSNCSFSKECLFNIANEVKILHTFDISLNDINQKTVHKLSEVVAVSQIKHFNISNCDLHIQNKFTILFKKDHKINLSYINFSGISMNDKEASLMGHAFSFNDSLEQLILSNCNLNSTQLLCILNPLKATSRLRHLDLMNNQFKDDVIVTLQDIIKHNPVEILNLSNCLRNTEITDLATTIAKRGILLHLNLSSNGIHDIDACTIISIAIIANPNLQYINLTDNHFSDEGNELILTAINEINSLKCFEFENLSLTEKQLMPLIKSNRKIHYIKIKKLHLDMEASLSHFKGLLCTVEELSIKNKTIFNDEIQIIRSILNSSPQIRSIRLACCNILTVHLKIRIFDMLCSLTTLHHLALNQTGSVREKVENHLVDIISKNRELNQLEIVGCNISDKLFATISNITKKLFQLNLSSSCCNLTPHIIDNVLSTISKNQFMIHNMQQKFKAEELYLLKCIDISSNPVTNVGYVSICNSKKS